MNPATNKEAAVPEPGAITQLRIMSGDGPVTRTVLRAPPRDADPSEVPVIDISPIYDPSIAARRRVAEQLRSACTNTGFFYVANHGISAGVLEAAHAASLAFFRQPRAVKDRASSDRSRVFNGYQAPRSQRINPFESVDVRESFSWKYDPAYDDAVADPAAIPAEVARCLVTEDFLWDATANLPAFKAAILEYWRSCLRLARALVRSFALSLHLPEDYFDAKFSYPDATFCVNYYPPLQQVKSPADEDTEVSIGSHTDFQLFTMLWQDSTGGLQVLNKQGQWIKAKPIEGTFVVNIADYMQRITNDLYVSTVHRVQNWSGNERISMPFFFGFNLNESCDVLDSCVPEGEKKKYQEISCRDWVERRAKGMNQITSKG
ncbi:2OG-Fe(II) oxygenase [Pestalotiopsis sp. NC0098]|nr:2OG-Fe(II) oxygenase [Pestalotiopsis sp. NC0098]